MWLGPLVALKGFGAEAFSPFCNALFPPPQPPSTQLTSGTLAAAFISSILDEFGILHPVDGLLFAAGMGEHAVLHSGLPVHWDVQCHDTEGQCKGTACIRGLQV